MYTGNDSVKCLSVTVYGDTVIIRPLQYRETSAVLVGRARLFKIDGEADE